MMTHCFRVRIIKFNPDLRIVKMYPFTDYTLQQPIVDRLSRVVIYMLCYSPNNSIRLITDLKLKF